MTTTTRLHIHIHDYTTTRLHDYTTTRLHTHTYYTDARESVTQYGEGCHAEASSRATPFPFTRPLPSLHQATPFPSPGHSLAFTRPLPSLPQATLFPSPGHSPGHSLPPWLVVRSSGTGTETPGTLDPLCARGALSLFFK